MFTLELTLTVLVCSLGAALAVRWIPQNLSETVSKKAQDFIDGIGIFGLVGIIAAFLFVDENDPTLYKIAFPFSWTFWLRNYYFDCASSFSFCTNSKQQTHLFGSANAPTQFIYGTGLFFNLLAHNLILEGSPWALYTLRLLIVFALADISLRLVELPVRTGLIDYWFKGMKYRTKRVQLTTKIWRGFLDCPFNNWCITATSAISAIAEGDQATQST